MDFDPWIPPPVITDFFPKIVAASGSSSSSRGTAFYELTSLSRTIRIRNTTASRRKIREGMSFESDVDGKSRFESTAGRDANAFFERVTGKKNVHEPKAVFENNGVSSFRLLDGLDSEGEKAALLQEAEETGYALDSDIIEVNAVLQHEDMRTVICADPGQILLGRREHATIRVSVTLKSGHKGQGIVAFPERDVLSFENLAVTAANNAVSQARHIRDSQQISGSFPVVFGPGWGGIWLHEMYGHLLEEDVWSTGPFAEKVDGRIAPESVTLFDLPDVKGSPASFRHDDTGIRAERTLLVENGILRGLIRSRRKSVYHKPALPRISNLYMPPGRATIRQLMDVCGNGLFVVTPGSAKIEPPFEHWEVDVIEGFLLDGGRVSQPVNNVKVRGSVRNVGEEHLVTGDNGEWEFARGQCEKFGQVVSTGLFAPATLFHKLDVRPG
jgi:TldD protein